MHFVYFLRSLSNPAKTYIGETSNLVMRMQQHNSGQSDYTSRFMPWEVEAFVMTDTEETAIKVEAYFKNTSGQEKLKNFAAANPDHPNPKNGYFSSLTVGKKFGRSSFKVKEATGTAVFTACD